MDITALFEKSCILFVVLSFYIEDEVQDKKNSFLAVIVAVPYLGPM